MYLVPQRAPNLIPWHIHSPTKTQENVYSNTRESISMGGMSFPEERESRPKDSTYIENVSPLPQERPSPIHALAELDVPITQSRRACVWKEDGA